MFLPTTPPSLPICRYLDVLHGAFERIDRLGHELQPVAGGGVEGPHPGRLGVRRGRGALLLLRLVGEVVLILQHLHFQHLTHHVSACAAQRRVGGRVCEGEEEVEGGGRQGHGGRWEEGEKKLIVEQRKQTSYLQGVLIQGWSFFFGFVFFLNKKNNQDYSGYNKRNKASGSISIKCDIQQSSKADR